MRASPAFQITLERFGAWRTALIALTALAAAALAAWWVADTDARSQLVAASLGLVSVGALCACAASWRCETMRLRWDGQFWYLASPLGHAEVQARRLDVALDLGAWMLLRFEHDLASPMRRVTWVPAQRRGHVPQWHALRCAVYCARPAARPDVGACRGDRPESEQ